MKRILLTVAASMIAAGSAYASSDAMMGDAAAGEKAFKKCKACHAIVDPDGNVIVKGGKVGPDLWGVIGRPAGSFEGYKYGKSLIAAGEAGLVWDQAEIVKWLANPKEYLRAYLDDSGAKSKMTFKLSKGAEDMAAYLATFSPAMGGMEGMDGMDGDSAAPSE